MMTGVVTAEIEAISRLTVRGPTRREWKVEAVVDTGYDGWLTLPPALIARLRLPYRERGSAILADGSVSFFDIYEATVLWDRQVRRIAVDEADITPLIGMGLLAGYELTVQVRTGGKVTIRLLRKRRGR